MSAQLEITSRVLIAADLLHLLVEELLEPAVAGKAREVIGNRLAPGLQVQVDVGEGERRPVSE